MHTTNRSQNQARIVLAHGKTIPCSSYLRYRELGYETKRSALQYVQHLVSQPHRQFRLHWQRTSKHDIVFVNHIYCNNYTEVRDTDGDLLYRLRCNAECECKIIACIGHELCLTSQNSRNEIIALAHGVKTQRSFLFRFDIETGEQLQCIMLAKSKKFKYLGWDSAMERFYVGSTKSNEIEMILFTVEPFTLVSRFTCPKSVFGPKTKDISFCDGCLIAMDSNHAMRFYDLMHIIRNQTCVQLENINLSADQPIPETLVVRELPEPVFAITSYLSYLDFGGMPCHFIHCKKPSKQSSKKFLISNLHTGQLVTNGEISAEDGIDDSILQFYDTRDRLMFKSDTCIAVYEIVTDPANNNNSSSSSSSSSSSNNNNNSSSSNASSSRGSLWEYQNQKRTLTLRYTIKLSDYANFNDDDGGDECTTHEASQQRQHQRGKYFLSQGGRLLTRKHYSESEQSAMIDAFDYEDELDMLAVLMHGSVHIFRNSDGRLLKRFSLASYNADDKHTLVFDRHCIIHLSSNSEGGTSCCCSTYKLTEDNS